MAQSLMRSGVICVRYSCIAPCTSVSNISMIGRFNKLLEDWRVNNDVLPRRWKVVTKSDWSVAPDLLVVEEVLMFNVVVYGIMEYNAFCLFFVVTVVCLL